MFSVSVSTADPSVVNNTISGLLQCPTDDTQLSSSSSQTECLPVGFLWSLIQSLLSSSSWGIPGKLLCRDLYHVKSMTWRSPFYLKDVCENVSVWVLSPHVRRVSLWLAVDGGATFSSWTVTPAQFSLLSGNDKQNPEQDSHHLLPPPPYISPTPPPSALLCWVIGDWEDERGGVEREESPSHHTSSLFLLPAPC